MIQFTTLETKYFDLIDNKISIRGFELWVYDAEWLEEELSETVYLDLISFNYNSSNVKYDIRKLIKSQITEGRFESLKMIRLLDKVIKQEADLIDTFIELYNLYCRGYRFLDKLAIEIGLEVSVSDLDGDLKTLNSIEKKAYLDSFYPKAERLALVIKRDLEQEDIKLLGVREDYFWQYIDERQ